MNNRISLPKSEVTNDACFSHLINLNVFIHFQFIIHTTDKVRWVSCIKVTKLLYESKHILLNCRFSLSFFVISLSLSLPLLYFLPSCLSHPFISHSFPFSLHVSFTLSLSLPLSLFPRLIPSLFFAQFPPPHLSPPHTYPPHTYPPHTYPPLL